MAKTPSRAGGKTPPAKAAAPRRRAAPQAGPVDQSRGSGPRVPTSAAAQSPSPAMYDPGDDSFMDEINEEAGPSALADLEVDQSFLADVREGSDEFEDEDLSADHEVTEAAAADAGNEGPSLEEIARIRAMRKPLGASSQKLALPTRRGYHRHWFNNTAGRIEEARAAGWAFVKGNDGKPIKRCVGTGRDKNALWAYAMELPLVFWQEDQDAKHDAATAVMAGLKTKAFDAERGSMKRQDAGKFYDPTEAGLPLKIAER